MARGNLKYDERRPLASGGFDPDTPTAGFYRMKLVKDGPDVAVRIWHGPPHDPLTGEEMDRSWRWQATANGEPIDLDRVWPRCGRAPITEAQHDRMAKLAHWARSNAPNAPQADPRKPINLLSAPLPF